MVFHYILIINNKQSYDSHGNTNLATPNKMLLYKHAFELYKLYNAKNLSDSYFKTNPLSNSQNK